jgi:hypothetical protein
MQPVLQLMAWLLSAIRIPHLLPLHTRSELAALPHLLPLHTRSGLAALLEQLAGCQFQQANLSATLDIQRNISRLIRAMASYLRMCFLGRSLKIQTMKATRKEKASVKRIDAAGEF